MALLGVTATRSLEEAVDSFPGAAARHSCAPVCSEAQGAGKETSNVPTRKILVGWQLAGDAEVRMAWKDALSPQAGWNIEGSQENWVALTGCAMNPALA
eukprot:1140761-Pelagomonas_calceolata.AAC.1